MIEYLLEKNKTHNYQCLALTTLNAKIIISQFLNQETISININSISKTKIQTMAGQ